MKQSKKALRKDFRMEIKKTMNRFVSIFLISALGAAFFAGVRSTAGDMKYSGDVFYDDVNLMDLRIMGTLGMTEADADAIAKLDGVESAELSYRSDALYEDLNTELVVRLLSYSDTMNGYYIKEGRVPERADECLADPAFLRQSGRKIGDTITLTSGTKDPISDTLITDTYTIVGAATTPMYMAMDRGTSSIGTGRVSAYLVLPKESFRLEAYTDLYLTVTGAKALNSYSEEYKELVAQVEEAVLTIEEERCQARYEEVLEEPRKELADAKQELADKEAEANAELADAAEKLTDAKQELADGRAEYEDGLNELADAKAELTDAEKELEDAKQQLADGRAELADAKEQIEAAKAEIDEKKQELLRAKENYESGLTQYQDGNAAILEAEAEIQSGEEEIAAGLAEIEAGEKELAERKEELAAQKAALEPIKDSVTEQWQQLLAGEQMLAEQEQKLAAARQQLTASEGEIEAAKETLAGRKEELEQAYDELLFAKEQLEQGEASIADAEEKIAESERTLNQEAKKLADAETEYEDGLRQLAEAGETIEENEEKLADAEKELLDGEQELADAEKEYADAKQEAEEKIADAKKELADAEEELSEVSVPEWYIFDREDSGSVYDFGQDADRIAAIGKVFPVMFFLVAALVSLTTMTRMVDEERIQIGTMKALGYSRWNIAFKYMMYGFLASFGGSIFGVLIGEWLFPFVISSTYASIMYTGLPEVYTPLNLPYGGLAILITTACTVVVTYAACAHELKSQPAQLMRPAPPRSGKRVFLERIPFLWKRLNFNWKSTVRNLFRYKKRFFMTVFGIGGCMALLLVGFGIKDSVGAMAKLQYSELWFQDAMITLNTNADDEKLEALYAALEEDERVAGILLGKYQTEDLNIEDASKSVTVVTLQDGADLDSFFCFRDMDTGKAQTLTDDGVILTKKLANLLGIEVGDTITLSNGSRTSAPVTVTGISEHYIQHYCYMTQSLYERLYQEAPEYNQCLVVLKEGATGESDELVREILTHDEAALSVQQTGQFQESVDNMLSGINVVTYVLIAAAGMLAFVVLYNLNNININERKRELATLKVLGFYNQETAVYVYRENVLLTIIGIIFGAGFGVVLHRFVMSTVEVDMVMFGRAIYPISYLYSIFCTFAFSAMICLVMYKKIRRIDMVESLKSVE